MANVATGIPAGICTVDNSESIPFSAGDSIGTPRTGRAVLAAVTPARCAAPPAAAMITSRPRCSAPAAYSNKTSGVRWAEITRVSWGTLRLSSVCAAWTIVSQSDREPMITPTSGCEEVLLMGIFYGTGADLLYHHG